MDTSYYTSIHLSVILKDAYIVRTLNMQASEVRPHVGQLISRMYTETSVAQLPTAGRHTTSSIAVS